MTDPHEPEAVAREEEGYEEVGPVGQAEGVDVVTEATEAPVGAAWSTFQPIAARLESLENEVFQLAVNVGRLAERVELIPRQVRQLGSKVDDVATSISHPRIRDLLGGLLLLYDLIDQMARAAESDTASLQNYHVLRDQVTQVLEVNGVYPISDVQCFDPALHKAVETITCDTPEEDGEIAQVCRTGFRTDRTILRYTEVVVKRAQRP
jgi:molecular chaperone GrpE (heat shock protein)